MPDAAGRQAHVEESGHSSDPLRQGCGRQARRPGSASLRTGGRVPDLTDRPTAYSYRSASIGSSLAAFIGRQHAEEDADRGGEADAERERPPRAATTGSRRNTFTRRPMAAAEQDARAAPPSDVRNTASMQELAQDLAAARAERLADADLARALGDRDGHDRHHADAADHQRDRRDDDEREHDGLRELVEGSRMMQSAVIMSKSFSSSELQAMPAAHDLLDLRAAGRPRARPARRDADRAAAGTGCRGSAASGSSSRRCVNGIDGEVVGVAERGRALAKHADRPCRRRGRCAPACRSDRCLARNSVSAGA